MFDWRTYRENNKERLRLYQNEWRKKNKKRLNKKHAETRKKLYQTNLKYRLRELEKSRKYRLNRKKELVKLLGSKCQKCGYSKCLRALEFHHKNPTEKETTDEWLHKNFDISKVVLLCSNCHAEEHCTQNC